MLMYFYVILNIILIRSWRFTITAPTGSQSTFMDHFATIHAIDEMLGSVLWQ